MNIWSKCPVYMNCTDKKRKNLDLVDIQHHQPRIVCPCPTGADRLRERGGLESGYQGDTRSHRNRLEEPGETGQREAGEREAGRQGGGRQRWER